MAKGFRPVDRDQQFLLPPDMRQWLPAAHLVWFLLELVDQLDVTVFTARHRLGGAGRQAYAPRMLLALLVYAYATGQRSSRQIERLCVTDVAYRVICAQDAPDHSTIARFRRAHAAAFTELFGQVLAICAAAGMGRFGIVATDGTKIAADAALAANHDRAWYARQAAQILDEVEQTDAVEDDLFGEESRGDELPPELADPRRRAARIKQVLADLDAEAAAEADQQAEADAIAAEYLARVRVERVSGHAPAGVDPVAAAEARLARERAIRQEQIDAYAAAVAAADAAGTARPAGRRVIDPDGGKRVKNAQKALENAKTKTAEQAKTDADAEVLKRNLTDPDSRIMPTRQGWIQGYNAQFAVTADHVIAAAELTTDTGDVDQFEPMLAAAVAAAEAMNLARPPDADPEHVGVMLADAGYWSEHNLTVPGPARLIAAGKTHQVQRDAALDPASGEPPAHASPAQAMRHRLRTGDGAALYKKRGGIVEAVNGHIKDRIGLRRFAMRGLTACTGELHLAATVHNLRRLFTTRPPTLQAG